MNYIPSSRDTLTQVAPYDEVSTFFIQRLPQMRAEQNLTVPETVRAMMYYVTPDMQPDHVALFQQSLTAYSYKAETPAEYQQVQTAVAGKLVSNAAFYGAPVTSAVQETLHNLHVWRPAF